MQGSPATARFNTKDSKYQRYLASREWGEIRERVRERSGNTCEHCYRAPQQAVHHMTYERVYQEHLLDLLAVCNPCHEWLSGKKGAKNPAEDYWSVSPTIEIEGLTPFHLLIPRGVGAPDEIATVHDHYCDGAGCIWCGYKDPYWTLSIKDLFCVWPRLVPEVHPSAEVWRSYQYHLEQYEAWRAEWERTGKL